MSYDRSMERSLTIADDEEYEICWELMQKQQISQSEDVDSVALEIVKERRAMRCYSETEKKDLIS
jgi:hypothetical protein